VRLWWQCSSLLKANLVPKTVKYLLLDSLVPPVGKLKGSGSQGVAGLKAETHQKVLTLGVLHLVNVDTSGLLLVLHTLWNFCFV